VCHGQWTWAYTGRRANLRRRRVASSVKPVNIHSVVHAAAAANLAQSQSTDRQVNVMDVTQFPYHLQQLAAAARHHLIYTVSEYDVTSFHHTCDSIRSAASVKAISKSQNVYHAVPELTSYS